MSEMYRDNRRRMEPMGFGGARVYVGDIGNRVGRHDLQREFEQYGQVLDVWMTPHQNDGRFQDKKFAFVVFRYAEDADIAVRDRNGRQVCGHKVRVEHAKPPKSQMGRSQDYQRDRGYMRGGRGRGGFNRGGYYNNYQGPRPQYPPRPSRYRSRSMSPRERTSNRSPHPSSPRMRRFSPERDHYYEERNRNPSFSDHSPDRPVKRHPLYSPDQRARKPSQQDYPSATPSVTPSPPRPAPHPDSDSYASRSPSPPPKKLKKKKKKHSKNRSRSRSRSPSVSPAPEPEPDRHHHHHHHHHQHQHQQTQPQQDYYSSEEGEYEKPVKSHKSKKSKSKKKKREIESGEDNSSDDY